MVLAKPACVYCIVSIIWMDAPQPCRGCGLAVQAVGQVQRQENEELRQRVAQLSEAWDQVGLPATAWLGWRLRSTLPGQSVH